jgi:tRNA wybutosine-synthesizing protein 1
MVDKEVLKKQGYNIVGNHSAVKLCYWMRQSLYYHRPCYKQEFYGINTHRCIQMTPSFDRCTLNCVFCWRYNGFESSQKISKEEAEDPKFLLDGIIKAQKEEVSGFKGDPRCDQKMWNDARDPKHVTLSLTGEPTLYPYLGEFIEEIKKRNMTSFLVTNGTTPEVLNDLSTLPTQLYISLTSYDEESFKRVNLPEKGVSWKSIEETMKLLPSLDTRKVIRQTLVKGWNMESVKGYARLISMAQPDFVEAKAYSWLGYSRERLDKSSKPSLEEIRAYAQKLSVETGYEIVAESKDSKVVLLSNKKKEPKLNLQY